MTTPYDLLVIGAGITGLHAARHAATAGLKVMTVESLLYGGLVTNVNELDGAFHGSGVDLAATLMQEVKKAGGSYATDGIQSIVRDGDAFALRGDSGAYRAKAVVIASGARLRKLGVPGENLGRVQYTLSDPDEFHDETIVVVGSGDAGIENAVALSAHNRVYILNRSEEFTSCKEGNRTLLLATEKSGRLSICYS